MTSQHGCEIFRLPPNQIRDLTIANFNDSELAIGSLDDIHRIEPTAQFACAVNYDLRYIATWRVRHSVHHEISPLGFWQEALNPPNTESSLYLPTVSKHVICNEPGLIWVRYD